ncbi:tetratricopeptide repeat-containing sensor histidine kinase [Flavobacterium cellulosilyticum]|uniref:histidine kinase n=1 Tax=Flavobacterium cellulosilyticum TaxID=2541731 RepID=A0A4R5C9P1_9FLAO|nr:tetratricopeptide repeat-containing sensor histidine kinase [Flavobacterium cellulosilyticum]TDD93732.1 sensor histidine kinase [Flavobacterium cellulosilyticum]
MQIVKNKIFLLFIALIFPFLIYPQNTFFDELKADKTLKSIAYKTEINFNKAYSHLINKKWDSALVYSNIQLRSSNKKEITDYCHFFNGYSLNEKKSFQNSKTEFNKISKNFKLYPVVILKLGDIAFELKQFKKAIQLYKKAESLSISGKKYFKTSILYNKIGNCYLNLKHYNKTQVYYFKSLKLLEKEKDTLTLLNLYKDFTSLYKQQFKYADTLLYFEKAHGFSKKISGFDTKMEASQTIAKEEEKRGNYIQAIAYIKESEQWKDSSNKQKIAWSIADFENKNKIDFKQNQINLHKAENKLINKSEYEYSYITAALFFILIGGAFAYYKHLKSTNLILHQKNKLDEINTTKDQLLTIVSHDLRASVNALKTSNTKLIDSLETKNYNKLDQLLHQNSIIANGAYNLLDNILHWVLLQTKELYFHKDSVHLYSIVQQIEYNYIPLLTEKQIIYKNSVSKNCFVLVDIDSLKIVLRNLFDNAIKFSDKNSKISIYTQETNSDFCKLIIEDTGIGIDQNTIDELLKESKLVSKTRNSEIKGTGLGIQLCKQMIKKNNGTLDIKSKLNTGTKIIISIPKVV